MRSHNDDRMDVLRKRQVPGEKWVCRRRSRTGAVALHQTEVPEGGTLLGTHGYEWERMYGLWDTPEEAIDAFTAYWAGHDMAALHIGGTPPPNPYPASNPGCRIWQRGYQDGKISRRLR